MRAADVRKRKRLWSWFYWPGQDNTVVRFCEHNDEISRNISVMSGARTAWSV